jgi:5-methylcytosine-specific restriction endonuclease McrA
MTKRKDPKGEKPAVVGLDPLKSETKLQSAFQHIPVSSLKSNPTNPRVLRDEKFECRTCGSAFKSRKACVSRTPKFCSKACYAGREIGDATRSRMSASRAGRQPHNKLPMSQVKCAGCSTQIPHRVGAYSNTKYCPYSCRITAYRNMDYSHQSGDKSHRWAGGVTAENDSERGSAKYRQWRTDVFSRDGYTCQSCGQVGGYLQADHIQPFAYHKELRYDLSNGRTLCVACHRKTDTFGSKALKHAV